MKHIDTLEKSMLCIKEIKNTVLGPVFVHGGVNFLIVMFARCPPNGGDVREACP